jgi:hypothetical protein
VRVAPGPADHSLELAARRGGLLLGPSGPGRVGGPVPADLLYLAQRRAHHVRADREQRPHRGRRVEAGSVERPDQPVGVPRVVRPRWRPDAKEVDGPRVPVQRGPVTVRVCGQVGPPVARRLSRLDLAVYCLKHELVQLIP